VSLPFAKHVWEISEDHLRIHLWWTFQPEDFCYHVKSLVQDRFGVEILSNPYAYSFTLLELTAPPTTHTNSQNNKLRHLDWLSRPIQHSSQTDNNGTCSNLFAYRLEFSIRITTEIAQPYTLTNCSGQVNTTLFFMHPETYS